jgi:hypothetical protein
MVTRFPSRCDRLSTQLGWREIRQRRRIDSFLGRRRGSLTTLRRAPGLSLRLDDHLTGGINRETDIEPRRLDTPAERRVAAFRHSPPAEGTGHRTEVRKVGSQQFFTLIKFRRSIISWDRGNFPLSKEYFAWKVRMRPEIFEKEKRNRQIRHVKTANSKIHFNFAAKNRGGLGQPIGLSDYSN